MLTRRLGSAALLALIGIGYAAFVIVAQPPCGFARTFAIPCPSCGSTRSMLSLLHGDWRGALRFNPLALLAVPMMGALGLRAVWTLYTTGSLRLFGVVPLERILVRLLVVLWGLQVVLWILRFFGFFGGPVPV